MAIKALNRKAEQLVARADDVRPYTHPAGDCCPGFAPGWEVGSDGRADPCPWMNDLPACTGCYWSAQIPDSSTYPEWRNDCGNISQDWTNLCTVPD
jgi:hypothetical protein